MQIKARRCFVAHSPSRWVARVFLTCDNMLAVEYRHGQHVKKVLPHGPGAYLGLGGVPHVCCLYPGTQGEWAETLYELARTWSYGGEWVHHFLYKKFGYRLVAPPAECGGCNTLCSLDTNPANPSVGQTVTITCKVTNSEGSPSKGDAPQGAVTFYIDGASLGTVTLPDNEPDTQNWQQASVTWGASCAPRPIHTLGATYTPSVADFAPTACAGTITVNGCSTVQTLCCPNPVATVLHLTISGTCLSGTYTLTYDHPSQLWYYDGTLCGIGGTYFRLVCEAGGLWHLDSNAFGISQPSLTVMSCDPVNLFAAGVSILPAYGGGGSANVTITA
jgi:hypothetical protein